MNEGAVVLAVERMRAARDRFARARRCAALAEECVLFGNYAGFGLRSAAHEEAVDAMRDLLTARSHLGLGIATFGTVPLKTVMALLRESKRDLAAAIDLFPQDQERDT